MNHRFMLLALVLCTFLATADLFAANAASSQSDGTLRLTAHTSAPKVRWDAVDDEVSAGISKPGNPAPAALGYYMLGTTTVGFTEFDHQSNERQQRQIAVGCSGNIHNVWIFRPFGGGDQEVDYSTYIPGCSPLCPVWYFTGYRRLRRYQRRASKWQGGSGVALHSDLSGQRPFANAGRYATLLRLDRFPANRLSGCPGSVAEYSELPRNQDRCRGHYRKRLYLADHCR